MKKLLISLFTSLLVLSNLPQLTEAQVKTAAFGVEKRTPDLSAENVPVDSVITISFTRDITRGSGEIYLVDGYENHVSHSVAVSGNILTITPSQPLKYRSTYSVALEKNAVENAEGDTNKELLSKVVYSFTTPNISDAEIAKLTAQNIQQPITLQLTPETALLPAQSFTVKQNAPVSYKLNASNGNYKLWTANPQLVSLQVQGDTLVVKGLSTGTTQVAVKNLLNNTKVVLNVVVQ
ncbi:Ig-like domain-containing protein [Brevibacillus porteri]|uniref:Ig-like domain-containing protein n=1 Tax=Brevibacillus porteri TaxID=2126350 RepID=UPI00363D59E0